MRQKTQPAEPATAAEAIQKITRLLYAVKRRIDDHDRRLQELEYGLELLESLPPETPKK